MKRMIIEGMDMDRTRLGYVIFSDNVKNDATVLVTEFPRYEIEIKGLLTREKDCVNFIPTKLEDRVLQEISYTCFGMPESPQIIIVEDGRVYSGASEERFEAVINDLKNAKGFEYAYKQIKENPHKFYY